MAEQLLGQTVTLTLNTRLDPTLPGLVLPSCVSVRPSVLTALNNCGYSQTVGGLLNLANKALAGQSTCGASLSDINNAIDSINSTSIAMVTTVARRVSSNRL